MILSREYTQSKCAQQDWGTFGHIDRYTITRSLNALMLSIYLILLFFRFSCSDLSLSCLSHRLFTRDSFKCSTYTHFGRRALALTQNTSSRQSAFFLTNHIKKYTQENRNTHTHKAKTTTAIIKSFFYTHKMERDAIKINVSFPFSLKSYLHVCYSSCCCWRCCSHWNCFSDIFLECIEAFSFECNSMCIQRILLTSSRN